MDDIVNLYSAPTPHKKPVESCEMQERQNEETVKKEVVKERTKEPKRATRKGDDYDESDTEDRERRSFIRPAQPGIDQSSNTIELAAYVLSGVMLIFLFESFITIGGHMQVASSHY